MTNNIFFNRYNDDRKMTMMMIDGDGDDDGNDDDGGDSEVDNDDGLVRSRLMKLKCYSVNNGHVFFFFLYTEVSKI